MVELLAPAGDHDQLIAAVQAGADAVYLGGPRYSARAYAGNFSMDDLTRSIAYCHSYGVKVYLAINTLLKERELSAAYQYALELWNRGVDALIVTDPGLMQCLKNHPSIERHASTQCSIHHPWEADFYAQSGITRAILARELQLKEIRRISEVIETETFVHGALCISYSGKCLMSSARGERSGNRGRCAQPCRLKYRLQVGDSISEEAHLLSPKDLQTYNFLPEILQAGVKSLKIEGRMRSASYVYEAVRLYRDALDGRQADPTKLYSAFQREGYHEGYFFKKPDHDLMARNIAKHTGVPIGQADDQTLLLQEIAVGDGLTDLHSGFTIERILRRGQSVDHAMAGERVEIYPKKYSKGTTLFKNYDKRQQSEIQKRINQPYAREREIPVQVHFVVNEPLQLTARGITVHGEVVQEALKAPLSAQRITEALQKRADTPWQLVPEFTRFEPGFYPVGQLNELRRRLIEQIEQSMQSTRDEQVKPIKIGERSSLSEHLVIFRRKEQICELPEGYLAVLDPFMRDPGSMTRRDVETYDRDCLVFIPTILREDTQGVLDWLSNLKHVQGIYTSNVAMLSRYPGRKIADYKLNLMNSTALGFYPIEAAVPSEELNRQELAELSHKQAFVPMLYGRQEMMITDYCLSRDGDPCRGTCRQPITLIDRYDEHSPILHDVYCRSHLYNSKIKNILDRREELERAGFERFAVELTTENRESAREVIEAFTKGRPYHIETFTRGHYLRGVL